LVEKRKLGTPEKPVAINLKERKLKEHEKLKELIASIPLPTAEELARSAAMRNRGGRPPDELLLKAADAAKAQGRGRQRALAKEWSKRKGVCETSLSWLPRICSQNWRRQSGAI